MEQSTRTMQSTDNRSMVLKQLQQEQKTYSESSPKFAELQAKIDHLVAQNFLEYVNS